MLQQITLLSLSIYLMDNSACEAIQEYLQQYLLQLPSVDSLRHDNPIILAQIILPNPNCQSQYQG